ncbi:MAG TPA: hypothetical protein VK184_05025 [Nostocaceae cyanobacterium]|nr:hypothetical protein [Nostocaceae cyanobacterium]
MDLEIFFNELCLNTPVADIETARKLMIEFVDTLKAVKPPNGVKKKLRTQENFNYLLLAPDYRIVQWRNDQDVDLPYRIFLKTIQFRSDPPLEDIPNLAVEVSYQGQKTVGLNYAFIFNSLAVSLQSEAQWECSKLEVEVITIDEQEQLVTTNESVIHASCINHVQEHTLQAISDGKDLWDRRKELFPDLEFCDNVRKQLSDIRAGQLELQPVIKSLREFQRCCQNWTSGAFSVENCALDVSGESEPTLNKYSRERTFLCPDDQERLFELHIKLKFCNWRIHFFPVQPGKVYIGYIGRHLPTVKYST